MSGQLLAASDGRKTLSWGSPSPRGLFPWKQLLPLFSVGVCDLLEVELLVRGSGLRSSRCTPDSAQCKWLWVPSGRGVYWYFSDFLLWPWKSPVLVWLCVHSFGLPYFSPSWASVIRPRGKTYVNWDNFLPSNVNLDKHSYFFARIKW